MKYSDYLRRYAKWLTFAIFFISVFMASFALRVELDASPENLLNTNSELEEAQKTHEKYFGVSERELIILLSASELTNAIDATETIMMALSSFPEVESFRSSTNTTIPLMREGRIQPTTPFGMASTFENPQNALEAVQHSSHAPFFMTEDGLQQAIYVNIKPEYSTHDKARAFLPRLNRVLKAEAALHGATAHLSGNMAIRISTQEAILRDASLIFPLALFAIALVAYMRFRSVRWIFILLLCIGNALIWTFGVAGIMGLTLTSLSVLFPVVILVSGIADGVHLLEYYAQRRYEGLRKEDAIAQMIEDLSGTSFWTSLTTIVGFAAIFVLPTAALRDFAFLIMIGSVFALINNLLLLPLLLNISKAQSPPRQHSMTFLAQTFIWSFNHSKALLVTAAFILIGCIYGASTVKIDHFPLKTLASDHQTAIGNSLLANQLGGVLPLDIQLQTKDGDFFEPDNLEALDEITGTAEALGWPTVSFSSLLRDLAAHKDLDLLPTDAAITQPLSSMLDNESDLLAEGNRIARIHTRVPDIGANALLAVEAEILDIAAEYPNVEVHLIGPAITQAHSIGGLTRQFLVGLGLTIVICIALTALALKDKRAPFIALLPNLLPIAVGFFFFGMTQTPIDLFTAALFVMAIGLTIDDTIQLIACFDDELFHIKDPIAALKRTAQQSGSGVWDTSLIIFSGFGMLCLSAFPATQTGGILGIILIGSGLICDIILVPAGLALFYRK